MSYFDYDPEPPASVTLFSRCLLSKWGFDDGDIFGWLGDFGIHDRHAVLCAVVRQKLLPVLTQKVEVEEISCCHNPIRARSVDGVDVSHLWYEVDEKIAITPDSVEISGTDILLIARAMPTS